LASLDFGGIKVKVNIESILLGVALGYALSVAGIGLNSDIAEEIKKNCNKMGEKK